MLRLATFLAVLLLLLGACQPEPAAVLEPVPLPTLGVRLVSVINCNTRHVGQIDFLRGLIKRGAWFPGAR